MGGARRAQAASGTVYDLKRVHVGEHRYAQARNPRLASNVGKQSQILRNCRWDGVIQLTIQRRPTMLGRPSTDVPSRTTRRGGITRRVFCGIIIWFTESDLFPRPP